MLNSTTVSESSVTAKKCYTTPRTRRLRSEGPIQLLHLNFTQPISTKIRVALRIRPSNELQSGIELRKDGEKKSIFVNKNEKNQLQFNFDHIFDQNSAQNEVYDELAKNAIPQCLDGQNICFFAYGQTGSGKTHSIMGTDDNPGLLPRFCDDLFYAIHESEQVETTLVSVSFFEIYQEKVYDLLSNERKPLRVRGGDVAYVESLEKMNVKNSKELAQIRRKGLARRATAATLVNELSSRSHAVFCLTVHQDRKETINDLEKRYVSVSNVYFVDLAGSERISYTNGTCLNETVAINISLLSLQKVIDSHAEGSSYINYRDSLLTRLLKDCFGGNSITTLIALISPEAKYEAETISTLRFASKAALVSQNVERNVDPFIQAVKDLKAENDRMRTELERLQKSDLDKKILDWTQPEPPCIIQLMPDPLMTFWTSIKSDDKLTYFIVENCNFMRFFSYILAQSQSMLIYQEDDRMILEKLEQSHEMYVNGKFEENEKIELFHGDRIVLGGKHFLYAYFEPYSMQSIPSYEKVKLEYVEASSESELFDDAKQELESEENEFIGQLKNEIEVLKEEHQKLLEKLELENVNKEDFACQFSELETNLKDAEELKKVLEEKGEQIDLLEDVCLKDEDRELALNLKAEINVLMDILKQLGKAKQYKFKLVLSGRDNDKSCAVRLTDNKGKIFSELNVTEFDRLRENICILYTEIVGNPKDFKIKIDNIIKNSNLEWKNESGRRSSIMTRRLTEALNETVYRRSSIVDGRSPLRRSSKNFNDRPSVIHELMPKISDVESRQNSGISVQDIISFAQGIATEPIDHSKHFLESLLIQIIEIDENLSNLIKSTKEKENLSLEDRHQLGFSLILTSNSMLNLRRNLSMMKTMLDEKNSLNDQMSEIYELVKSIAQSYDSWLSAFQEASYVSEVYESNFKRCLKRLYEILGYVSILNRYKLPTENRFEKTKEDFYAGLKSFIEETMEDAKDLLPRYQSLNNNRARILSLVFKTTIEMCSRLQVVFDEILAYGVFRVMLELKEFLMTSKSLDFSLEAIFRINEILSQIEEQEENEMFIKIHGYLEEALEILKN